MTNKSKIIVANWKMNPETFQEAEKLFGNVLGFIEQNKDKLAQKAGVIICPPFVYLHELHTIFLQNKEAQLKLGAQNCFWEKSGAFTGEISPQMIRENGGKFVILGHSERRINLGETDEMINKKIKNAFEAGLSVILCVGEPLAIRQHGAETAKEYVKMQIEKDLLGFIGSVPQELSLVIAYEPIWAIGDDTPDTPQDASFMASFIKKVCAEQFAFNGIAVLYGGSTNDTNAGEFMNSEDIDGLLVGGASLRAEEFNGIIKACFEN